MVLIRIWGWIVVGLCLVLGHVGVDTYKVYCGLDHVEDSVAGYVLRHQLVWRVDMVVV